MKTLITGATGQDGAYLAKHLMALGHEVYGGVRRSSSSNLWRLEYTGAIEGIKLIDLDLLDPHSVDQAVKNIMPDYVYNLAAQSFVGASFNQPISTFQVNATAVLHMLEAVRAYSPEARFYQASTSELYGLVQESPQSEKTPFHPRSPYGVAKLAGHWATINYREAYGLHASTGILFNHESPLRGAEFVTRKIAIGMARMSEGASRHIELGNLSAERDWGYAEDYVAGMRLICEHDVPEDFVLATGEMHSVREFVFACAVAVGFEPESTGTGLQETVIDKKTGKTLVTVNPKFYRPAEVEKLQGDASKARAALGWSPKVKFQDLAVKMVLADLERVRAGTPLFESSI